MDIKIRKKAINIKKNPKRPLVMLKANLRGLQHTIAYTTQRIQIMFKEVRNITTTETMNLIFMHAGYFDVLSPLTIN